MLSVGHSQLCNVCASGPGHAACTFILICDFVRLWEKEEETEILIYRDTKTLLYCDCVWSDNEKKISLAHRSTYCCRVEIHRCIVVASIANVRVYEVLFVVSSPLFLLFNSSKLKLFNQDSETCWCNIHISVYGDWEILWIYCPSVFWFLSGSLSSFKMLLMMIIYVYSSGMTWLVPAYSLFVFHYILFFTRIELNCAAPLYAAINFEF